MPTLNWIGKDKVLNHHLETPFHVLERKYSFDEQGQSEADNGSENMIIHGDNLLALKSLLPKYEGKIKCIYIDPPYNTGNENWVYNDNVNDPQTQRWLHQVVGKEGEDLSRHDKWLCMMYPRLKLLQRLLADDGAIFISIDDNEQANLKLICDEIFGAKNLLAQFVWRSDGNFDNQAKIKVCHEYIISYIKNIDVAGLPKGIDPSTPLTSKIYKSEIRNTVVKNGFKNPISDIKLPKGFPSSEKSNRILARNNTYPIYLTDALIESNELQNEVIIRSGWASKTQLESFIQNHFEPVIDSKGQLTRFEITSTGAIEIIKKRENISHVMSILTNLGSTQSMSQVLMKLGTSFDFPKPVKLVEYLLEFYSNNDSIILDSFAGSGTTAHAVLNMNKRDGGERKFICVEMMDYADSITAERVKRVIKGYKVADDKEEIIYDAELKPSNLTDAPQMLAEAKAAKEKAKASGIYTSVGNPKIAASHLQVTAKIKATQEIIGTGGGFSYYELGAPLLIGDALNEAVSEEKIREYVYYMETRQALPPRNLAEPMLLGVQHNAAYYFYYQKGARTVLNREFLHTIKTKAQAYVIYADVCALAEKELQKYGITFKKIPRDIAKL